MSIKKIGRRSINISLYSILEQRTFCTSTQIKCVLLLIVVRTHYFRNKNAQKRLFYCLVIELLLLLLLLLLLWVFLLFILSATNFVAVRTILFCQFFDIVECRHQNGQIIIEMSLMAAAASEVVVMVMTTTQLYFAYSHTHTTITHRPS